MTALLRNPAFEELSTGETEPFSIVVVYEDIPTKARADRIFNHIQQELATDFDLTGLWIPFEALADSASATRLAKHAVQAHLVVFSTHAGNDLPESIKLWIESWLPLKNPTESALVALIGLPEETEHGSKAIHDYLREVAARRQLDLLSPQVWPTPGAYSVDSMISRATTVTTLLEAMLLKSTPPPRWGINE